MKLLILEELVFLTLSVVDKAVLFALTVGRSDSD